MKSRTLFNGILMVVLVVWGMSFVSSAQAAITIKVWDSTETTLRGTFSTINDAIANAATINGDIIKLSDGVHTEPDISVTKNLTIKGAGANSTTVQAAASSASDNKRVFSIGAVLTVTISDMTIQNGGGGSTGGHGGGIYNNNNTAMLTVTNCKFINNKTDFNGGGIANDNSSKAKIINCLFTGNKGASGGGIRNGTTSTITVTNCTFDGNIGTGKGISNKSGSTATVTNCIFNDDDSAELDGTLSIANSLVKTDTDTNFISTYGASNKFGNPNFDGTSHLQSPSPAIDTGLDSYVDAIDTDPFTSGVQPPLTDLDGNPRKKSCSGNSGVDMGAYEYQGFSSSITVTSNSDPGTGSLREAISSLCPGGTINITATTPITLSSEIVINKDLTINGPGADKLTITTGSNTDDKRVFNITGGTVKVSGITIFNSGGTGGSTYGGGVKVATGTLELTGCTFDSNKGYRGGGVAVVSGTARINNCTFSNNGGSRGGGMHVEGSTTNVYLTNCTFSSNTPSYYGGGLNVEDGNVEILNCTFSNNSVSTASYDGGGINITKGTVTITNSTITGNTATNNGGGINIITKGTVTITNSTITGNTAANKGGGIFQSDTTTTVNIKNTIVANNTVSGTVTGPDLYGTITSQGYNLIKNTTDCTISGVTTSNITGQDPQLHTFDYHGGTTKCWSLKDADTAPTASISPAIDAIPIGTDTGNGSPDKDQRGLKRPGKTAYDIGAYEAPTLEAVNITPSDSDASEAGDTASYTISLTVTPTAAVTISFATDSQLQAISSVTFDAGATGEDLSKPITVNAVNDDIDEDETHTSTISHTISASGNYATTPITPSSVTINITDNDTAGVTVSSLSPSSTISESSGSASFNISLTSQPTSTNSVTISLSQSAAGKCTFTPESVTLDSSNWDTGVTVTVTASDDYIDDGDQPRTIVTGTTTSSDPKYSGTFDPGDVTITIQDDDTAGVTVSPNSLTITEPSETATFNIKLTSQPTADVQISLTQSATGECSFSPASSITLNSMNWSSGIDVTVTGIDDSVADGNTTRIIHTGNTPFSYGGSINPDDVTVTINDDDEAGITVSAISGNTTEAGGTATFTVKLQSEPVGDVKIKVSSEDTTEGTVLPSSLTFTGGTGGNWNTPETVTVTGVNDDVDDGDISYNVKIEVDATTSTDTKYKSIASSSSKTVSVTNEDNDIAGITITRPPDDSTDVSEAGTTDQYKVKLDTEPQSEVTITLTADAQVQVSKNGTDFYNTIVLTFPNNATAMTDQPVTVKAIDDPTAEGNHSGVISHTSASDDSKYKLSTTPLPFTVDGTKTDVAVGSTANLTVKITDNDMPGVTIMQTGGSTEVSESGASDTYKVKLNTSPTDDVNITVDPDTQTKVSNTGAFGNAGDPITITFAANATGTGLEKTITVKAEDDPTPEGTHFSAIKHTASSTSDSNYNGAGVSFVVDTTTTANLSVKIDDNDAQAQSIVFSLGTKTYGDPAFVGATAAPSGYGVTLTSSSNTAVATVGGNVVYITGVGSTTICGEAPGTIYYTPASGCGTLTVQKADQTVNFSPLAVKTYSPDKPTFAIGASASSGLTPVTFSSLNPAVATVSGNIVTIVGAGAATIRAYQAGNENYNAASADQVLTVNKADQTLTPIAFTPALPASINIGEAYTMSSSASSGLSVTFRSTDTAIAIVSGYTLRFIGKGPVKVCVSQGGNANYNPAPEVCQNITVNGGPTIVEGGTVSVTMDEDGYPKPFDLTLHASDPEGETLTWRISTDPSYGKAGVSGTGESKKIAYTPDKDWHGADLFEVQVSDSSGGATRIMVNVTVVSVNDAPVLDAYQSPALASIQEDPASNNGNTVAEILPDAALTDADGTPVKGIAVISVDNTNGVWQYSLSSGNWLNFTESKGGIAEFETFARLLGPGNRIRFAPNTDYPYGNYDGMAKIMFRAWDMSQGSAGATANVSGGFNGSTFAFSSAKDEALILVKPVDDAPRVAIEIRDVEVLEDADPTLIDLTYTFTEVDNDPTLIVKKIQQIDTLAAAPKADESLFAQVEIIGNRLMLKYAPNQYGKAIITVEAISNGKTVTDAFMVTIHSQNDPPKIPVQQFPRLAKMNEDPLENPGDSVEDILTGEFTTDTGIIVNQHYIMDADGNAVNSIAVTAVNNRNGKWQYSLNKGASWSDFTSVTGQVAVFETKARLLDSENRVRFVPAPNFYGQATFTFRAWDKTDGRSAGDIADASEHGGISEFSLVAGDGSIRIEPADDPPMLAVPLSNMAVQKNSEPKIINLAAVFTDIDNEDTEIVKYLQSNSNLTLMKASVEGNTLTLDFQKDQLGESVIKIAALSNGKAVSHSFTVKVTESPVVPPPASSGMTAIDEDTFSSSGNTVAEIFGNGLVKDADGKAITAIAVTAVSNKIGKWQYSLDSGKTWNDFTSITNSYVDLGSEVRLLDSAHKIRFVPRPNYYGKADFSFVRWDKTVGTPGGTVGSPVRDTSAGFGSTSDSISIKVNAVDDPPAVAQTVGDILLDGTTTGRSINLAQVFTDIDNDPALITKTVTGNTNASLAQASINGNTLTLNFPKGGTGKSAVTIRADSNGKSVSLTFNVILNHAPVLTPNLTQALPAISENAETNEGISVAALVLDGSITDPDGVSVEAIAVTSVDNTNGRWQYSTDKGLTWYDMTWETGKVVDLGTNARLLDSEHRIRFVPNPARVLNDNGKSTFTFRAWDRSEGAAGASADASENGGRTAFSSAVNYGTVTVEKADDPPVVAKAIADIVAEENAPDMVIDLSGVFTDPDNDSADIVKELEYNTNPELVTVTVDENVLILKFQYKQHGQATISVLADSAGLTTSDAFNVTVKQAEIIIPRCGQPGDVNGDGIVTLADLVAALKAVTNQKAGSLCLDADVNADGKIGIVDAVYILGFLSL